jgi:uncharacterized membrane protein
MKLARKTPGKHIQKPTRPSPRVDAIAWLIMLIFGVILGALSIRRFQAYTANMFDLGNMTQAIRNGLRAPPLQFTYKTGNYSRLAFHVELIYFLFVPIYRLFPSPITLLVIQALFYALGAVPVYHLARRNLESSVAAKLMMVVYLLYPVAQTAILADFHGDTLAMPLLLFAINASDNQRWRWYTVWLLLALSCKFYVALAVMGLGIALYLKNQRRAGLWTIGLAVFWGIMTHWGIRARFADPTQNIDHFTPMGYLSFYFNDFFQGVTSTLIPRVLTAIPVLLPAILALFAPVWLLPIGMIVGPVLLSNGPASSYFFKNAHYATAVPFLIAGVIYGLKSIREADSAGHKLIGIPYWILLAGLTVVITFATNVIFLDSPFEISFWLAGGAWQNEWIYKVTPRDHFKDLFLARFIPDETPMVASSYLASHLVQRRTLYIFQYPDGENADIERTLDDVVLALSDVLPDTPTGWYSQTSMNNRHYAEQLLKDDQFDLVKAWDGLLLFQKEAPIGQELQQQAQPICANTNDPLVVFDDALALTDYRVTTEGRRLRLQYEWIALKSLPADTPLLAISRFEDVEVSRIVHLPSYLLWPTTKWASGCGVRESFSVDIPNSVATGRYRLVVRWYDPSTPQANPTRDNYAAISQEFFLTEIIVE